MHKVKEFLKREIECIAEKGEISRADVEPLYYLIKSYSKISKIDKEEKEDKKDNEELLYKILCMMTYPMIGEHDYSNRKEYGEYPIEGNFGLMLHQKGYEPPYIDGRRGMITPPRRNRDMRDSRRQDREYEEYNRDMSRREDGNYYNEYSRMADRRPMENYYDRRKNYDEMQEHGHKGEKDMEFTQTEAKKWLSAMENMDGTTGPKYTMEQTNAYAKQAGVVFDKFKDYEWNVVMNMMYSDYCEAAKHFNVDKPEYYAALAKAFLYDDDSVDPHEKISAYFNEIVKPAM